MNAAWADLVTIALLGTERRAAGLPLAAGALGGLLAQIDQSDREGALLSAAAAIALHRRASQLPVALTMPAAPSCDVDDLPVCPARAESHLNAMLGSSQRSLLPEWLAALARLGRRVPAAQLADLLELGRAQPELRAAILPVLGKRGAWLAAQNLSWAYAAGPQPALAGQLDLATCQELWQTGSRFARLALLGELRTTMPELARELLQSTWATEKADDRNAFVGAFERNLRMADEPLLESLLDDRSKEVRRRAANLLARLPESRLARRMLARAQPLLSWTGGSKTRLLGLRQGQPARLVVNPPADCDAAMLRDGIEPQPPAHRSKLGQKAWLLIQLLSATPLASWSQQWQATPAELIKATAQSEWQGALLEGWLAACLNTRDAEWAEALLAHDPSAADLIEALPAERQEAQLLAMLRGDCTPLHKHPVLDLLRKTEHTWSIELTRAVLRAVHRHMRKWQDTYDYQLRGALAEEFARRLPPAMLAEVAAGWPQEEAVRERWQGVIDKLLITLQFRHDMLAAFDEYS